MVLSVWPCMAQLLPILSHAPTSIDGACMCVYVHEHECVCASSFPSFASSLTHTHTLTHSHTHSHTHTHTHTHTQTSALVCACASQDETGELTEEQIEHMFAVCPSVPWAVSDCMYGTLNERECV